jgi:hypothetical protein
MTATTFDAAFGRASQFFVGEGAGVFEAIRLVTDYLRVREIEETRRNEIRKERDIAVSKILAERDLMLRYFDGVFEERKVSLGHFYRLLDHAVENGDNEQLERALQGIVGIVTTSPLLGFNEFWQAYHTGKVEL